MKALCIVTVVWSLGGLATAADRLESDVLGTAGSTGLPRKPDLARKEIEKRRKHHLDQLKREWKKTTKEVVKNLPSQEVKYRDSREKKAVVRFRSGGRWVYRSGSMHSAEKALLSVDRGVSECWVKHALNKSYHLGYEISQSPGIPSKQYYSHGQEIRWRKCSWDASRKRWALVPSDLRKKVERDYRTSLQTKRREAESQARRGPQKSQLDKARSYAKRVASTRSQADSKEKRFRIDSDVGMAYFRVAFAYDQAILAESIRAHMNEFRKIAWGK